MSAPRYRVMVQVDRDDVPLMRIEVDPLCLHVADRLGGVRRATIAHAADCACGALSVPASAFGRDS